MSKRKLAWVFGIIGGVILVLFLANYFVKQRLQKELNSRLEASSYQDLNVNIYLNRFSIEDVEITRDRFALDAEKIKANGFSYYKYLFQNELEIDNLEMTAPRVTIFPKDSATEGDAENRPVFINEFSVKNGSLSKRDSKKDSVASFFARIPEAVVKEFRTGMKLSELKSYKLQLDSVYLKMSPEHYMDVGSLSAKDGNVDIADLKVRSFFPRSEFDRRIPYEKDHITLDVKKIELDSFRLQERQDSLYLRNHEMKISEAYLNLYRNKLVADDPSRKPLYSEMLREAPVFLNFEKILLEKSEILYEEKIKEEDGPAKVRFTGINGAITNLHNIRELSSQPKIDLNAHFMRGTPVNLNLTFPVFSPQNQFKMSGDFGRIEGEALDPFLIPARNVRARGTVNDIYFNFYGNDDVMQGDFRINYDDFKIELLTSEKENKKGFLSSLANLLVDNKQEPEEGDGQNVRVERTKNRSFWNYAWKGLREGLIDALGQL